MSLAKMAEENRGSRDDADEKRPGIIGMIENEAGSRGCKSPETRRLAERSMREKSSAPGWSSRWARAVASAKVMRPAATTADGPPSRDGGTGESREGNGALMAMRGIDRGEDGPVPGVGGGGGNGLSGRRIMPG